MASNRRLPVYFLLDTSGSMVGEPIESMRVGLQSLVSALRQDPHALETLSLSLLTFDRDVRVIVPLTSLEELQLPRIECPDSGPTNLGIALKVLRERVGLEVRKSGESRDWRPLLFVFTDGGASDRQEFNLQVKDIKSVGFASIIGCAAGPKAKVSDLEQFCEHVVKLENMDARSLASYFQWVSTAVSSGNVSMGANPDMRLPAPPVEINVVI